jgi:hypothetical protein
MLFDKSPMKEEQVDEEQVWSAIRYLDSDEQAKQKESNRATTIAVLALLLIVCAVWGVLWLRVRGL